jgi:predicted Zn-dependent protease
MSLNNLAWIYHQSKDPRALEYAEKAFQLASENPAIQDTLAWILVEKGEIDRALPILEKAALQLPDNATVQYHYAHALVKAGNQAKARQILGKITAGGIDFPEIEAARALMKQTQ